MSSVLKEAAEIEGEIISTRRRIHSHPELAFKEFGTSRLVAQRLKSLGFEVKTGVGGTGVIGLIRGSEKGKVVALRADMDALPVQEEADIAFRSEVDGVMHACGHDAHVAMLLGAARLLATRRHLINGQVKLLFQPAEEDPGKGGALPMVEDGAMENPRVGMVFATHVSNALPAGTFGIRAGPLLAQADNFRIKITGKGGHGSAPHFARDPIFVSTQVIASLYGISSRMVDPVQPFALSVCSIHSGTNYNTIPDSAVLEGTVRTLSKKVRGVAIGQMRKVTTTVCKAYGASCELTFGELPSPVVVNSRALTKRVAKILRGIKGAKVSEIEPILGGEDFSRFLEKAPGVMYFLGTRNPRKDCIYPNHSSKFKVDEDVLKLGAASLASIALEFTGTSS